MAVKLTVPDVIQDVWDLYATKHGNVGGCLHIVLDDDNVEDSSVRFCIDYAKEKGCEVCLPLAEKLLTMSETQRGKLASHAYCNQYPGRECRCQSWR